MEEPTQIVEPLDEKKSSSNQPVIMAIALFAVLIVAGVGYKVLHKGSSTQGTVEGTFSAPSPVIPTTTPSSAFKDGTYTEEGSYMTHVGQKKVKVQLTLKNGVIVDSTVTEEADDRMSIKYQDLFIGGYKQYVTGKNIADVHLSKVSGSSLTPNGFNDALQKIETDAKS